MVCVHISQQIASSNAEILNYELLDNSQTKGSEYTYSVLLRVRLQLIHGS